MRSSAIRITVLAWLVASAQAAPAFDAQRRESAADWARDDDALLVVLVFEGLRADALDAEMRDGTPLLPALASLATQSTRFDDVLTGAPHVQAGAFELLSGTAGRRHRVASRPWGGGFSRLVDEGFTPIVGGAPAGLVDEFPWLDGGAVPDLDAFVSRLIEATGGRRLALYFSGATLPPYVLEDAQLDATDPEPWADAPPNATVDELAERRRGTARSMTRALRAGQALGTRRHAEVFEWIAQAAAVDADTVVARVVSALEAAGRWPHTSLLVTSTLGTATGDRGVVGAACGVDLGQAAVPLLWRFPGMSVETRSAFPAQLQDVASTLVDLLDARGSETGLDLFDEPPEDRDRLSVAWFERAGRPQAGFRLTRSASTLLVDSEGQAALFDRRWDRSEFEDLASREGELVLAQRDALAARLWGDAPQLWILAKGEAGDLLSGIVRGRHLGPPQTEDCETLDAVRPAEDRVAFSLVADELDVVKIPLTVAFDDVVLEIQSPRARSPVFLGSQGTVWSGREVPIGSFEPTALQAWVGEEPPDPEQWLTGRPAGITIWLVSGGPVNPAPQP